MLYQCLLCLHDQACTNDSISWRCSNLSNLFFSDETPLVKFSKDSELRDSKTIEGISKTYKDSDLCFINGVFIDPGYIHDVLLTGLEPSTTYYYSCGVENVSDFLQVLPPLQINDCGIICQRLQM